VVVSASSRVQCRKRAAISSQIVKFLVGVFVFYACGSVSAAQVEAKGHDQPETIVNQLPKRVGAWTRGDVPRRIESKGIFEYMDGGGELYLGYRFKFLEVHEYASANQENILVELYWMESADDAYGLLSGDWGGDAVDLSAPAAATTNPPATGEIRALYGAGLLRIWSGNLYARIMAYQETDESKKAVLAIGEAIVSGRTNPPAPSLVKELPAEITPRFRLQPKHTVFLRSHLVLNSVYYLSSENLLDLGLGCEVAVTSFSSSLPEAQGKPVHLLLVRYPSTEDARQALKHFQRIYLAEKYHGPTGFSGDQGTVQIEDGWLGFARTGSNLALVFECPDEESAKLFMQGAAQTFQKIEVSHE
jgi:hypothetical protein